MVTNVHTSLHGIVDCFSAFSFPPYASHLAMCLPAAPSFSTQLCHQLQLAMFHSNILLGVMSVVLVVLYRLPCWLDFWYA